MGVSECGAWVYTRAQERTCTCPTGITAPGSLTLDIKLCSEHSLILSDNARRRRHGLAASVTESDSLIPFGSPDMSAGEKAAPTGAPKLPVHCEHRLLILKAFQATSAASAAFPSSCAVSSEVALVFTPDDTARSHVPGPLHTSILPPSGPGSHTAFRGRGRFPSGPLTALLVAKSMGSRLSLCSGV